MASAILRFSALGAVLSLIAGCGGSTVSSIGGSSSGNGGGSGGDGSSSFTNTGAGGPVCTSSGNSSAISSGTPSSSGNTAGSSGGTGGDPTVVTFAMTNGTPMAVAVQIGSGPFTAATPTSGQITLSLPGGTSNFAVAFVCQAPSGGGPDEYVEYVYEASTLDGTSFSEFCDSPNINQATGTLTGFVDATKIPGYSSVEVEAGNYDTGLGYTDYPPLSFSFDAPSGSDRVSVLVYGFGDAYGNTTDVLLGMKTYTGQTVPGALNGANNVVFGAADEVTQQPITYSNVPSPLAFNPPTTAATYNCGISCSFSLADAAATSYPVPPAGATVSGDSYSFVSSALGSYSANGAFVMRRVFVDEMTNIAGPLAVTLPNPWNYAGPTPAALPTINFAYTGFMGTTGVIDRAQVSWSPSCSAFSEIQVAATANFLAGASSIAVPDLSPIAGFLNPPISSAIVNWSASTSQGNSPPLSQPSPGWISSGVSTNGSYTVP